jgi:hypothetical protein
LIPLPDSIDAPHIEWKRFECALAFIKLRTSDKHIRKLHKKK